MGVSPTIQYVTSFGPDMYHASGSRLLDSLLAAKIDPKTICVCYEGALLKELKRKAPGLLHLSRSLDDYPFLVRWLQDNRDRIPDYLGGLTKMCDCPGAELRHKRHRNPRCHWTWMNRNASRWFRKVASYRVAMGNECRYLIWLDADCRLHKPFDERFCQDTLKGKALAYCCGHRPAIESGVLIFDMSAGGEIVIRRLCDRYVLKRYAEDERWDDGFQLTRLMLDELTDLGVDLVHPTKWRGVTNDVIPTTVLSAYVSHDKGRHGKKLGIMK